MRNTMKRLLLALLALTLLCGTAMPAAMAAEQKAVANTNYGSTTIYAGMNYTIPLYRGSVKQSNSLYKWKTSKSSVVKVTSSGVITGMKAGTATVTATCKSNKKDIVKVTVTVKRNKVDNINYKPSASSATYKSGAICLKSVEIVSPTKVVAEYYVAFNFPSKWKASKINYVQDAINLYYRGTGLLAKTIVGDSYQLTSKSISGFKARKGKSVQVIKVTYTGSRVHCANIKLSDYIVNGSRNIKCSYKYYH